MPVALYVDVQREGERTAGARSAEGTRKRSLRAVRSTAGLGVAVAPRLTLSEDNDMSNVLRLKPKTENRDGLTEKMAAACPFCGGEKITWSRCGDFFVHGPDTPYHRLVCWQCGSGTTPYPPDQLDACLRLWNTRAHEDGPTLSDYQRQALPKHAPKTPNV